MSDKKTNKNNDLEEIKNDTKKVKKNSWKIKYETPEEKKEAQNKWSKQYDGKFEKFLARLPQGTRERFEALGFESGNIFINEAVKNEFERLENGEVKPKSKGKAKKEPKLQEFASAVKIEDFKDRINRLGYKSIQEFIDEAIEEKLSNEEAINPPVDKKVTYSMKEVLNEGIAREKKKKNESHEL